MGLGLGLGFWCVVGVLGFLVLRYIVGDFGFSGFRVLGGLFLCWFVSGGCLSVFR